MSKSMHEDDEAKKILCVGLCCLDMVVAVATYPQEDQVTDGSEPRWQRGGNASNNCTVLSMLACPCELMASFARSRDRYTEDNFYLEFMLHDLENLQINCDHCVFHRDYYCPISHVILNKQTGSRTIVHSNRGLPEVSYNDFKNVNLSDYSWIHFEGRCLDQALMMKSINDWNQTQPKDKRVPISFEMERRLPNYETLTPLADYVFVDKGLALDRGLKTKEEAIDNFWVPLKDNATLVFPWGDEGAAYRTGRNGPIQYVRAYTPANGVVDTLAAGDTFIASSIFALSRGYETAIALDFGCQIAGAKIGFHGFQQLADIASQCCQKLKLTNRLAATGSSSS